MRIAILDPRIHAPGLIKIFPEADYYVVPYNGRYDLDKTPSYFKSLYSFDYKEDLNAITPDNYDYLFIVYAVHDFPQKNRLDVQHHYNVIKSITDTHTFKKTVIFSNDDCRLDPTEPCKELKYDIILKRNVHTNITYPPNVIPFPFIMFGYVCPLWELLERRKNKPDNINRINRVLFAGFIQNDSNPDRHPDYLGRGDLMHSCIRQYVQYISTSSNNYYHELTRSKYGLDMNGAGDPNKRTFELLASGSLILQQYKYMVWPFDSEDYFFNETIYATPEEFVLNLQKLEADPDLYNKALAMQNRICNKYYNVDWLRQYILKYL